MSSLSTRSVGMPWTIGDWDKVFSINELLVSAHFGSGLGAMAFCDCRFLQSFQDLRTDSWWKVIAAGEPFLEARRRIFSGTVTVTIPSAGRADTVTCDQVDPSKVALYNMWFCIWWDVFVPFNAWWCDIVVVGKLHWHNVRMMGELYGSVEMHRFWVIVTGLLRALHNCINQLFLL